jgi:GntR family transcriptional regulator, carbon starvation induced regulator
MMAEATQVKTRLEEVYRQLRYAVMTGRLKAGQRVRLADLCEEYDVSLSVVREAATRLAENGLFRSEPNRGFRVAPLSVDDLLDLTFVRVEIESLCLRRAVKLGDTAWEAGILAAHHTLRRAAAVADDPDADIIKTDAHSAFHMALTAACDSPRLMDIRSTLFDSAELYRHWSLTASASNRDPAAEHAGIVDAALERDVDTAVERLVNHIRGTTEWLISGAAEAAVSDASRQTT